MSSDKIGSDDGCLRDGTVTRKIRTLQETGVLDDPKDDSGVSAGTTAIKTYPFKKTENVGFARLTSWLKKN